MLGEELELERKKDEDDGIELFLDFFWIVNEFRINDNSAVSLGWNQLDGR